MRYGLLSVLLATTCYTAEAQYTTEYLDINQIKAIHMVHGDMWRDVTSLKPGLEFPKGTGKYASYLASVWMSGRDNLGQLHTSAAMYGSKGWDYYSGPLDASGKITLAASLDWNRIWKINSSDIAAFLALGTRTLSTIPTDIREWPAKGNLYAKGAGGVSLTITTDMAPFVDVDADGIYDPIKGIILKSKGTRCSGG